MKFINRKMLTYNYINRRILMHILFWFLSGIILITMVLNIGQSTPNVWERFVIAQISQALVIIIGIKILIPRYLLKKNYRDFILTSLAVVIAFSLLINIIEMEVLHLPDIHDRFKDGKPDNFDFLPKLFPHAIALVVAALGETLHFAGMRVQEANRLKAEKLESEMKFLKSQINPHFLFNALNNVYTLSIIKADETPEVVLKLSDMLRYMLYDCKENLVPLHKELDYIKNYIDLYQLKEENSLNIEAKFDTPDTSHQIPPMLFIPFIENSFKHSKIEDTENGWIKMEIVASDKLYFYIQNSIPAKRYTKDKVGGIGLENIKRRLELLYPDDYLLTVKDENGIFDITMIVNL